MLATHDLSADKADTLDPDDLFTISAGGFSATADAFARDPDSQGLWFLSMVGSQTALKAIWASLLKQPPDIAHIIKGAEGMALSEGYQRCSIPYATIGTWTTKIAKLPVSGGWHALVYTKTAEYAFERDDFLLLAQSEEEAPEIHRRFLDKRSPLPLHRSWTGWLWDRGMETGEIAPLPVLGGRRLPLQPRWEAAQGGPLPMRWRREGWRCRRRREGKMDRTLKAGQAAQQAAEPPQRRRMAALLAGRQDLPVLPARRLGPPVRLRSAPLLQEGDGGGARRPQGNAVPPRHPGLRLDAGAAGGRRQSRRAHNRLLYRVRGGGGHLAGTVLPAHPRHRRGGGGRDKQHERRRTMTTNQTIYFTCPSCEEALRPGGGARQGHPHRKRSTTASPAASR